MNKDIADFIEDLQRRDASLKTVANYQSDLLCFTRWFVNSTEDTFTSPAATPTDIRDYKRYLLNVENRKPAAVNRRLAALRKSLWYGSRLQIDYNKVYPLKLPRERRAKARPPNGCRSGRWTASSMQLEGMATRETSLYYSFAGTLGLG